MLICLFLNGSWSDYRVLSGEHERTAVQELQLTYLNTLFMQEVCSHKSFIDCDISRRRKTEFIMCYR